MRYPCNRRTFLGIATSAVAALALPPAMAAEQETIWQGRSDGYDIDWRSDRLDVLNSDKRQLVLSFGSMAERDWQRVRELAGDRSGSMDRTYSVLSAVGPWLSVEEGAYCDCGGAHPSEARKVLAFDLRKGAPNAGELARLNEIFPDKSIMAAMIKTPLVRSALDEAGMSAPDTLKALSLQGLLENLNMRTVEVDECSFQFRPSLLSSFVFERLDVDSVAVKLALPAASEVCRGQATDIELLLSLVDTTFDRKELYNLLSVAQAGDNGLLAPRANAIARGRAATFSFTK
jgi:hypothetical protein